MFGALESGVYIMGNSIKLTITLLQKLGFEYEKPYWRKRKENGEPIAPTIYQKGTNFFIQLDAGMYCGLKHAKESETRQLKTLEDLYECYKQANVDSWILDSIQLLISSDSPNKQCVRGIVK